VDLTGFSEAGLHPEYTVASTATSKRGKGRVLEVCRMRSPYLCFMPCLLDAADVPLPSAFWTFSAC
jgi:hypothetical protein